MLICMVDDGICQPGNLRELAKREARRANIIVVTKCPQDLSAMVATQNSKKKCRDRSKPEGYVLVFLDYDTSLKGRSGED